MMNHATFKASLFMAAGIVDHETGTRDLKRLSGLAHAMPLTATVALVAAAAMAGVPLLNGFLSKEMFFAETMFAGEGALIRIGLPAAATLAGMFSVAYSLRFIHQVFFGPPRAEFAAHSARADARDAVAERAAGARLPARRHPAGARRSVRSCIPRPYAILGVGDARLQPCRSGMDSPCRS